MADDDKNNSLSFINKYKIICLNDLNIFNSFKMAGDFYNIKNASNIRKCCKGEINYCGKLPSGTPLKWAYYKDYINSK